MSLPTEGLWINEVIAGVSGPTKEVSMFQLAEAYRVSYHWDSPVELPASEWQRACMSFLNYVAMECIAMLPPSLSSFIAATNMVAIEGNCGLEIIIPNIKSANIVGKIQMAFEAASPVLEMELSTVTINITPSITFDPTGQFNLTKLQQFGTTPELRGGGDIRYSYTSSTGVVTSGVVTHSEAYAKQWASDVEGSKLSKLIKLSPKYFKHGVTAEYAHFWNVEFTGSGLTHLSVGGGFK